MCIRRCSQALDKSATKLASRLLLLLIKHCLAEETSERLSPATCLKRLDIILKIQQKSSFAKKRWNPSNAMLRAVTTGQDAADEENWADDAAAGTGGEHEQDVAATEFADGAAAPPNTPTV